MKGKEEQSMKCNVCNGRGKVSGHLDYYICPKCNGTGMVCQTCNGTGFVDIPNSAIFINCKTRCKDCGGR